MYQVIAGASALLASHHLGKHRELLEQTDIEIGGIGSQSSTFLVPADFHVAVWWRCWSGLWWISPPSCCQPLFSKLSKQLLPMSMTFATSSRASSLAPSNPTREQEPSAMTWAAATFTFPPRISCPARAPVVSRRKRSRSRETRTSSSSSNTSRIIHGLPGFDDFADLVMSSERAVPKLTLTSASDHSSPRISRSHGAHPHRSKPSEPKSTIPIISAQTASLPWSKEGDDTGRVTFIFGQFRPSILRQSAPPSVQTVSNNQVRSKDFVNLPSPQEQHSTQS
ncbi:hypothetical protein OPQ81_000408 [Rhizoctonia solani]|nr:hypothetical protein OPQ81_000408 [Rhizoctonia solani]